MKLVRGIWFPDGDSHFEAQLEANPLIDGRGTYQYRKYMAARDLVSYRRHAVDVGAHVGLWSRVMARDFDRVTALEPLSAHRECFERNVEGATLLPYAAGAHGGDVRVRMPPDNTGNAHIDDLGENVRMVTLDSLDLDPVDLLKIDVEGFERAVVEGAEQTIRRNQPVVVVEQKPKHAERYGWRQLDAVVFLKDLGMVQLAVLSGDYIMAW